VQAPGHGLAGLADRLKAVDGVLVVDSPRGGPTRLTAELPA
jgi:signal transduction histidine kinase